MADQLNSPTVLLEAPDGRIVPTPVQEVPGAFQQGYQPASPDLKQAYEDQQKYGGVGSALAAGAEGALGTLLPGVGPAIERAFVPAEDILGRARAQPGARIVGQVGGAVIPAILSGGTTAAAEGAAGAGMAARALGAVKGAVGGVADMTAPNVIAKIGGAAEGAIAGAGKSALARIGGEVANQAAQGALYSGSDILNRAVLGDPKLTAEQAISEVGLGTLIGGGFGALGGISKGILRAQGENFAADLPEYLRQKASERNIKAAGAIQRQITKAERNLSDADLHKIGMELAEPVTLKNGEQVTMVGPFKTYRNTFDNAQLIKHDVGERMGDLLETADNIRALHGEPMDVGDATTITDIVAKARKAASETLGKDPHQVAAAERFEGLLERYEKTYEADPFLGFKELHEIRQHIDNDLYGWRSTLDPERNAYSSVLRDFRHIVGDTIESDLQHLSEGAGWGWDMKSQWKTLNRNFQVASYAQDWAHAAMQRAHGNNLISPMEMIGGVGTAIVHGGIPAGMVGAAATHLVRVYGSGVLGYALSHLADGLESLGAGSMDTMTKGVRGALSGIPALGAAKAAEALTQDSYKKKLAEIDSFSNNPEKMAQHIEQKLGPIITYAPNLAGQIHNTAMTGAQYLASIAPRQTKQGPFDIDVPTSRAELARFNAAYQVVNNPMSVLDSLAEGTITPDHMNALTAVYPQLAQQMRQEAMAQLADAVGNGVQIPTKVRAGLTLFIGNNMDNSTTPQILASTQAVFNKGGQQQNEFGPIKPHVGGLKGVSIANLQTPMQKSANRK